MTIRDDIREILAEGRVRTAAQISEALGKPLRVVQQQLGAMHDVAFEGDSYGRHYHLVPDAPPPAPRTRSRREPPPPPEPAEPVPFDAAVWMDGSLVMVGAEVREDGSVLVSAGVARRLLALLHRALPAEVAA